MGENHMKEHDGKKSWWEHSAYQERRKVHSAYQERN